MNRYPEPARFEPIPRTVADNATVLWALSFLAVMAMTIAGLLAEGWLIGLVIFVSGFAGLLMGMSNAVLDMKGDGYIVDRQAGPDGKKVWRIGIGAAGGGVEWM